ncbi:EF-P 5-aminopentanol modification-associated protein YfmF [Paenibacillus silvae]|uniref:EF-P 5-aminopentanol modification-associated protein YfmF n=1 Tax=Paenibacillus silvae TaxID=1325358 RepID=UPI0020061FF2|nr:pitrilysin family protein [Paenibacillus silvae]MCK6073988.1 insulinase family protein [Paenibacillus silvae]MCK6148534.1 insulinase family protein [Paenibacillus silvae]MCK6266835.1 insulinase family protein [Paenibacillus silvae]
MNTAEFERGSRKQLRIHVLPTTRFKTFAISLYAGVPLREDTVTQTALIPFVLRRGTESYPETTQFREQLEHLYGAGFGFDVYKRGDYQIVQFRMDTINDSFVGGEEQLLDRSFAFLGEVLTKPAQENGHFKAAYVHAERETVRKKLESIVNDKMRYAAERCIEEMCKNEPYRLHPLGERKVLPAIEPAELTTAFRNWLGTASMDLYVVGDTTLEEVEELVERHFSLERTVSSDYQAQKAVRGNQDVNTVIEKLNIGQGKLNMGLRTSITYGDDNYAAALLYNGILGGYPHSKLFVNVREKESLAYYASSRYDGHKGIATIQSGIEIPHYEKAVAIIKQQLEEMRSGNITDLEMSQTKAMIRNLLKEMQDAAFEIIAYDFNRQLSGKERTPEELLAQIEQVTKQDVREAAEQFRLDTIYFLRDEKEE